MSKLQRNYSAMALLWTQDLLLLQAKRMPKEFQSDWLHAAAAPIRMMHYANPDVVHVAERISTARIERFVRNCQGRRLPA